ncbi:MAG: DJ-1/PfpI/YhbO family deglycase/protease [Methanosarcinaceae archaeon]|nr:DJ-1/PfpI/YhbO family deglycase/protease [Methanosarcinaceae archaeon]
MNNLYISIDDVIPSEFDILVLPGGKAPEKIRLEHKALEIARHFFNNDKTVAAICHGAQTLISAGLLKERRATCYIAIRDDLKLAGATYEDREVVVDGNLVTSRHPADLYAFGRELVKKIKV